jgi:hypothetical protein
VPAARLAARRLGAAQNVARREGPSSNPSRSLALTLPPQPAHPIPKPSLPTSLTLAQPQPYNPDPYLAPSHDPNQARARQLAPPRGVRWLDGVLALHLREGHLYGGHL